MSSTSRLPRVLPRKLLIRFFILQAGIVAGGLFLLGIHANQVLIALSVFLFASIAAAWSAILPLKHLLERLVEGGGELPPTQLSELHQKGDPDWEDLERSLARLREESHERIQLLERERDELTTLMGSLPEAIVAIDSDHRVLFYNARFALLFKAKDVDFKDTTLEEVFRVPEVLESFRKTLTEKISTGSEFSIRPKTESSLRNFSLSVTPLKNDQSVVYGAIGVFHDFTELKKAERVRIDFVANVSHELRTPLTAIKGFSETLTIDMKSGDYAMAPKYLDAVNRNVDRLMALVEDLLDLSSLESGHELDREWVSTRDVTDRVLTELDSKRRAKGFLIETQFSSERVYGAVRRIEQVLVNLIDNALKYTPVEGKIRIQWTDESGFTVLRVIDNGPGVPQEALERLFERFYRVDKARSREIGGTGLGLAIVKHIVQRHGGSVLVKSEPGHGAEFVCRFPFGRSSAKL